MIAVGAVPIGVGILEGDAAMLFWTSFAPFHTHEVHEGAHIR